MRAQRYTLTRRATARAPVVRSGMPARRRTIPTCTAAQWRAILDQFNATIPPPGGWRWRVDRVPRRRLGGDHGDCDRVQLGRGGQPGGVIALRVADDMSDSETADVLLHEAAHGFDRWDTHGWGGDHGDTFWLWLGRLYRRYHGIETG